MVHEEPHKYYMDLPIIKSLNTKFVRTLVLSFFGLIVAGAVFLNGANTIRRSSAKAQVQAETIAALEERISAGRRSAEFLESRGQEMERIRRYLADRERPLAFIEQVEGLADFTNTLIALDLIERDDTPPDELAFRITADGSERDALILLQLIERMPYEIRVEEFTFQKLSPELLRAVAAERGISGTAPATRLILLVKVKAQ